MTPDEITETYGVLAPMATDYANANLERAGQAQASYGPLAQAAMGDSQTAGIGNYTYNRLVRPAVDTMRDQLIVEGYSAALNKQLSDSLNAAKNNYNRAARKSGGGGTTDKPDTWSGDFEEDEKNPSNPDGSDYNPNDYISNDYNFYNYGNVPGNTSKKYPLSVDTPTMSTTYEMYTQNESDPFKKGEKWINFLYSIGYTG